MSTRFITALSISMCAHAALISTVWVGAMIHSDPGSKMEAKPIFLDPVAIEAVQKMRAQNEAVQKQPRKKRAGIKPSQLLGKPQAQSFPAAAPAQDKKIELAPLQHAPAMPIERRAGPDQTALAGAPPAAPVAAMKSGTELMANPKTRGTFADYYGLVRSKIQEKLREKCQGITVSHGNVELAFILKSDGSLQKVYVMDRQASLDPELKGLAVAALREATPFLPFPEEFKTNQIAFNLTIFFNDKEL